MLQLTGLDPTSLSLLGPLIDRQVVLSTRAPPVSFPERVPVLTQLGGHPVTHYVSKTDQPTSGLGKGANTQETRFSAYPRPPVAPQTGK